MADWFRISIGYARISTEKMVQDAGSTPASSTNLNIDEVKAELKKLAGGCRHRREANRTDGGALEHTNDWLESLAARLDEISDISS